MGRFEEAVEGQFDKVDPARDPELVKAAWGLNFSFGDGRTQMEARYFDLASKHGLSEEQAKNLYLIVTSGEAPLSFGNNSSTTELDKKEE